MGIIRFKSELTATLLSEDELLCLSRKYLLELRDDLLQIAPTNAAYHHGAADILLFYANTKYFFIWHAPLQGFSSRQFSYAELGYSANANVKAAPAKKYNAQYVWGQLAFWERH